MRALSYRLTCSRAEDLSQGSIECKCREDHFPLSHLSHYASQRQADFTTILLASQCIYLPPRWPI